LLKPPTKPKMKFAFHAKLGPLVSCADADQYLDDAVGPPIAAKPGSMQGGPAQVVA
jgi:hypothetical protein